MKRFRNMKWLRPEQFMIEEEIKVFGGKVDPNDVIQGQLMNSGFLCALASIAEYEDRIKEIFRDGDNCQELDEMLERGLESGCFLVKIYQKGEKKKVIIDDQFVCDSNDNLCFGRMDRNELWVTIIEKAWAKVYGSFVNIEGGSAAEYLHGLTGAPTRTFYSQYDDQELIWQNIMKGERNNYVMCCGCQHNNVNQNQKVGKQGLMNDHCYSLLAAYEINYKGEMVRLVKLRNPLRSREWIGPWSDNSSEWDWVDQQVKIELQMVRNDNDGLFFMQFQDYVAQMDQTWVCLVNDNFKYNYIRCISNVKRGKLFKINIKTSGQYYFTVNQTSKRQLPKSVWNQFKYKQVTMVLAKLNKDGSLKFIEDTQKAEREVWTAKGEDQMIEVGHYLLFVKVQWNVKQTDEFVLSSYGTDDVDIQETNQITNNQFLSSVYLDHSRTVSQKKQGLQNNGQLDAYICNDGTDGGYQFVSIWNQGNSVLDVVLTELDIGQNMKLKKPFNGNMIQLKIGPSQHQILLFRVKSYLEKVFVAFQLNYWFS